MHVHALIDILRLVRKSLGYWNDKNVRGVAYRDIAYIPESGHGPHKLDVYSIERTPRTQRCQHRSAPLSHGVGARLTSYCVVLPDLVVMAVSFQSYYASLPERFGRASIQTKSQDFGDLRN